MEMFTVTKCQDLTRLVLILSLKLHIGSSVTVTPCDSGGGRHSVTQAAGRVLHLPSFLSHGHTLQQAQGDFLGK